MRQLLYGALAGMAATMAMTATIGRLESLLPRNQRYPLPSREITQRILGVAQVRPDDKTLAATAMAAHFAFGGLAGAIFPLFGRSRPLVAGGAYGLAVWAVSYLGWLPATRLLAPATVHPMKRNLLMLAAHAIWGMALSSGLSKIEDTELAFRGKATPDAP